jgi:hypothetical protein
MKTITLFAAVFSFCLPCTLSSAEPSSETLRAAPLQFAELEKAGFVKPFFRNLKDDEQAAFYKVYPADKEMLDRVTIGDSGKLEECIAGEAPPLAEAFEKFPLHYPMLGRMQNVTGVLQWTDNGRKLIFRTARQQYHVDEFHIVHRLERMGFTQKSAPRKATLDAVWTVNRIDALRFLYMQQIELQ